MINNKGHALTIGQPYQTRYDNRNDVFTLNAIFGNYADMENKKTRQAKWVKVDDLIPLVRIKIKSYLAKADNKDSK